MSQFLRVPIIFLMALALSCASVVVIPGDNPGFVLYKMNQHFKFFWGQLQFSIFNGGNMIFQVKFKEFVLKN